MGGLSRKVNTNKTTIDDLSKYIKDGDDKTNKNYILINDLDGKNEARFVTITKQIQNFKDISAKDLESIKTKMQDFDDRNRANTEKIISSQETTFSQAEKIQQVQALNDETRNQDKINAKGDLDKIIANNAQGIDDLRKGCEENISNIRSTNIMIDENSNGLQIKSEETRQALAGAKKEHQEDTIVVTTDIEKKN